VPSPQSVVADMLKVAEVGPSDFVIDLGSGDGRIVLTARRCSAPGLRRRDQGRAGEEVERGGAQRGLADRVKFIKRDLFKTDISQATVLTMYLLPDTVNLLKDKFLAELKPGTASSRTTIRSPAGSREVHPDGPRDKVHISGVTTTLIYMYVVPAKVAGNWSAKMPAAVSNRPADAALKQQLTRVSGSAKLDGKEVPLEDVRLRGDRLTFRWPGAKASSPGR